VSAAAAGGRAATSAALGLGVVLLFFVVSLYLVEVANRVAPSLTLPAGLTVYSTLMAWLGFLGFSTTVPERLDKGAFAWTVISAALGWVVVQAVAVWRRRVPYVDVHLPQPDSGSPGQDELT
jgi:ATP synthase protein I